MASVMQADLRDGETLGDLANNYMVVQCLWKALSVSETNIKNVPNFIKLIHERNAWRAYVTPQGQIVRWNAADFREFIKAPAPSGLGSSEQTVRHMVKGTNAETILEVMMRGEPRGLQHDSRDESGRFHNRNNVTDVDEHPATIPLSPDVPRLVRVRDYQRESKQGNSVGYTIRRLEKIRPDLLEQVKAGEMSPNAAAVKAGFREPSITIPSDPLKAAVRLKRHFDGERREVLVRELRKP